MLQSQLINTYVAKEVPARNFISQENVQDGLNYCLRAVQSGHVEIVRLLLLRLDRTYINKTFCRGSLTA